MKTGLKTLHFDCFAGISGDMTLGALVELGVESGYLQTELRKLPVTGWTLDFRRDERCGISGTRALVTMSGEDEHSHDGEHHHHGDHGHSHEHHHEHRHWKDIRSLIKHSAISESAKTRALDIFTRIAEAEALIHGKPVDEVAFHEVGAVDSIIDIVGAAICLDVLRPDRITASPIELGGGTVTCAHGVLSVPAPATLALCKGLPVSTGSFDKEMTTPTGAAILASCVDEFITQGSFIELKTAYGIGTRKLDKPNVLRVSWREEGKAVESGPWQTETLTQIEAAVDDMSGEALGFLMERLFEAGALDVNFIPCTMKKSRPGVIIAVLCGGGLDLIRETLVKHSTTIGFRETRVQRLSLPRKETRAESCFGPVCAKTVFLDGKALRSKIEFADRARIAKERGISLEQAEKQIASSLNAKEHNDGN
jgi:uncharacterized protein (TIGR00299 family) protein